MIRVVKFSLLFVKSSKGKMIVFDATGIMDSKEMLEGTMPAMMGNKFILEIVKS